jgi:hypothetical protein
VKAPVSIAEDLHRKGDDEIRRLYEEVFGEQSNSELEDGPASYQETLLKSEYPNEGKLRDYQAEGVSWLISNYVNKRSSILADEMGKFGGFAIPSLLSISFASVAHFDAPKSPCRIGENNPSCRVP